MIHRKLPSQGAQILFNSPDSDLKHADSDIKLADSDFKPETGHKNLETGQKKLDTGQAKQESLEIKTPSGQAKITNGQDDTTLGHNVINVARETVESSTKPESIWHKRALNLNQIKNSQKTKLGLPSTKKSKLQSQPGPLPNTNPKKSEIQGQTTKKEEKSVTKVHFINSLVKQYQNNKWTFGLSFS